MKKATLTLVLFAVCCCAFLIVYPVYETVAIRWPKVESYESLLEACDQLLQEYASGSDLPRSAWPSVLLQIDPRYVFVENGYVDIVISSGGIGDSWGLIVAGRNQAKAVPSYAIKTDNPRVFRYK